ncbi:MAG: glycoside hydrolase family 1 protein [Candidatus Omnitrophota bacterium]
MMQFPAGFFWGAATSAYQVEGDNVSSDWWAWEKKAGLKEPCGQACRHYEFYAADFELAKSLNHNAHRFSIEWARIEPQEGRFSPKEIEHYRCVIKSLRERGLEPIITLHHFTNPIWFSERGGWLNKECVGYYLRYVLRLVNEFSDSVRFWVSINEPMVYAYHGYVYGLWPPQERSFLKARQVISNMAAAHVRAYKIIHDIYQKRSLPSPLVGIAHNMQAFVPCSRSLKNRLALYLRDRFFNFEFLDRLAGHRAMDFIGLNYYTRGLIEARSFRLRSLAMDTCQKGHFPLRKNSMGWDIYPQGLYELLVRLKRYRLPVFILENGICTDDDNLRWDFIRQHLKSVYLAIAQGVAVMGYIYWSLLDNYEWDKGFSPRFGLIGVDYNDYSRNIRNSARNLSDVYKTGTLKQ